ncbi:MAG: gliding motility-associated ABC transporter substrate-binding protein GldG [Paludibacteraceae bacterium]|nr:gliding motility-associated ABC transporter substrate-binding protein GldG [Paludibacteraceae bacterium]MBQ2190548.1 gliding motility-associated ABC transporter substrate-binding protein GldG [Paludibacteraceae bacterium]MBQ5379558.1 gliding motility-associated ABC transporter substrate-binding protein GldG [Paludibacteraceae bacterium]
MRKYSYYIFLCGLWLLLIGVLELRPVRWDMTDDKHYSLSEASKNLLRRTDAPIEVTLLLNGDLNAGFRRLQRAANETLEEMDVYGDVRCTMYDVQSHAADSLGLNPIIIHEREQNGKTAQTTVYPYALMQYKNRRAVVTLLKNTRGLSGEENLNASIEQLEFAFMEALHMLTQNETPRVVILEGHGEPDEAHTYDLMSVLSKYFQVDRGAIMANGDSTKVNVHILDGYKAVIIMDPQTAFSDEERFIIDQYIMRGGTVLWALNGVQFSNQVLQQEGFTPIIPLELGLTELLFRYGIRVNPALVQDIQCLPIPVNVSSDPQQPNLQPMPWTYAPLLLTSEGSPITRGLGQVMSTFVSPLDAVGGEDGIEKRILLATSTASRITASPGEVDLNDLNPDMTAFVYQYVPVAVSLEGVFASAYAHRMVPEGIETDEPIRKTGVRTRQVVIAGGSMLLNETQRNQVLPMGYDRYSGMQFSNRDFAANAVLWLTDSEGLIRLREKSVALRLLNDRRAHQERLKVQLVSTICPVAVLLIIGCLVWIIRKWKYEK